MPHRRAAILRCHAWRVSLLLVTRAARLARLWALPCLAPLAGLTSLTAQDTSLLQIHSTPQCSGCRISLERLLTLGSLDQPSVGPTGHIVQDSNGRFYFGHDFSPTEIMIFGENGTYLRSLGRAGSGPGEFQFVSALRMVADSLFAFDLRAPRLTVFSPALTVARTVRLPTPVRNAVLFLERGEIVANGSIPSPDLVGFPLHLFTSAGELQQSFGASGDEELVRPDMPILRLRHLEKAGEDRVWAAHYNEYRIEEWTTRGARTRTFLRSAEWFAPWYVSEALRLDKPPRPAIQGIHRDDAGLLWILVRVHADDWRLGLEERASVHGADRAVAIADWDALFDTIVEIVDPASGQLLLSQRIPPYIVAVDNRGRFVGYREGGEGVPYLDVYRVTVRGPLGGARPEGAERE